MPLVSYLSRVYEVPMPAVHRMSWLLNGSRSANRLCLCVVPSPQNRVRLVENDPWLNCIILDDSDNVRVALAAAPSWHSL